MFRGWRDAYFRGQRPLQISNGRLGTLALAYVYASAGRRKEALEQVDKLMAASQQRFVSPAAIGMVYATLGDHDMAFKFLEKGNDAHDLLAVRLKSDPRFAVLRGDPRFNDLVNRMGLP